MNTNRSILTALLIAVAMVSLTGCACPQQAATSDVRTVSSRNIAILWADSHLAGDKVVVHGTFKRKTRGSAPMKTHVDVQVLSAAGDVLQEVRTPEITVPRNLTGKGIKFERFEVELQPVSAGSTVVLTAHQGDSDV